MVHNFGVTMEESLIEEIDDERHSTVTRSGWLTDAARVRLALEDADEWENWLERADADEETEAAVPDGGA